MKTKEPQRYHRAFIPDYRPILYPRTIPTPIRHKCYCLKCKHVLDFYPRWSHNIEFINRKHGVDIFEIIFFLPTEELHFEMPS